MFTTWTFLKIYMFVIPNKMTKNHMQMTQKVCTKNLIVVFCGSSKVLGPQSMFDAINVIFLCPCVYSDPTTHTLDYNV